ncbi:MAG: histidine kinase [Reinekea sp.]
MLFTIILLISLFLRTMILKVLNHYIIEPITKITSSVHSADFNNATLVEVLKIQQRNEVLQAKAIAEDKQNKWLASELHDELGAQLVSLKWSLQAIEQNNSAANLTTAKENLNRLISLVKNFIAELRPEELETLGLSKSLDLMVVKRNNQAGLCRYKLTNQTKDEEISGAFSHAIYRVCQESLTNIAKHSSATSAEISMHIEWLSNNTRILELKVRDNGNGFSYNESFKPGGHGIDSMKERVISLGGVFQLLTEPGAGTEILVMLPLPLPFE